jgi:SPP1 gp7 family putative phage head morphogenesis protein
MTAPTIPHKVTSPPPAGASANDTLLDLLMERAVDLLRLEAGTRNQVVDLLTHLEGEVTGLIAKIDPTAPVTQQYQRQRLERLLKAVTAAIRSAYRGVNVRMASEVRELVDAESTWTASAINASIGVEFADAGVTRSFLETLASNVLIQGAPTKDWWGRQAAGLADRFADEMRRGMAIGETNADLIARVRGTKTATGLMDIARNSAERLVRASVQTAANTAREAVYAKNTDLIAALQWHATLDTRTSEWCITRDGHQYTPVDHEPIGKAPPWLEGPGKLHWGCRSTSVPVLKSWRDLGIDADEVPDTTRASMDGQVSADMSFETWLKKQSRERQDTVLGESKADLWRTGKITFRDLLDQNGRPISTADLRRKAERK